MAQSLREQIANREDLREKDIQIETDGAPLAVRIRRMTVGERKGLIAEYKISSDAPDNVGFGIAVVSICVIPPMTLEEIRELPSAIIDALSREIVRFNGWTTEERAKQADQFRPQS